MKKLKKTKNKIPYVKIKNLKDPLFGNICSFGQLSLKKALEEALVEKYEYHVQSKNGYLFAKGDIPVLLTAHLDTVHLETPKQFFEFDIEGKTAVSSPTGIGGDDRCGVYIIIKILEAGFRPSILFCEDEEIGCVGAKKFEKDISSSTLADIKFMIELDRANEKDMVFYSCDNPEFEEFIKEHTGYKKAFGSMSDISVLAPAYKVAAVNLSCGYYKAHTSQEYVIYDEMYETIEAVKKLLVASDSCDAFEYIEKKYSWSDYGLLYGKYNKDYYGQYSFGLTDYDDKGTLYVYFTTKDYKTVEGYIPGSSEEEAFGTFFMENKDVCFNDILDYDFFPGEIFYSGSEYITDEEGSEYEPF